jgi:quercetin dioxygenase-like cupin family protein
VSSGSAKFELEGQTLNLKRGDSWLVPAGAVHQYTIIEPFTAVEATADSANRAFGGGGKVVCPLSR